MRAFTLVLKTTQGRPVGLPDDEKKLPKYSGIAAWLATRVQGEIADAGEAALDSVFIPAAKIMRSLSREEGKVLYPLPEGCHTFLKLVAQRIDQRKNVSTSGSSDGAVSHGHYAVPVSGLRFEEEIFASLSLPEVQRPAWLRLENRQ